MTQKSPTISLYILKNTPNKKLHSEILTPKQEILLPLVKSFSKIFGLVGDTAFALHLGHRRSIDFDLFTNIPFKTFEIRKKIIKFIPIEHVLIDNKDEYTISAGGVKFTFFHYPFRLKFLIPFNGIINIADLKTLSAIKAHALGRRAKWKDYIDLYFVTKIYSLKTIIKTAYKIFGSEFNEKLFRVQLAYFDDIDYSEKIIFMEEYAESDDVIKETLKKLSLEE